MSSVETKKRTTICESDCACAVIEKTALKFVFSTTLDEGFSLRISCFKILTISREVFICVFMCSVVEY